MSRFFTVPEAIRLRLLGNRDYGQRDRGRLISFAKPVYHDMNLTSVRKTVRRIIPINRRTNTIDMPCKFRQLSSVNVMDECGNLYPIYRNDNVHDDIVESGEVKDCACEYECGHKLCNTIKSYEAVVETRSDYDPDGVLTEFECTDRKGVDGQGFFYEQTQYPQRRYVSGVYVALEKHTEDRKLCKVEVDENGCVCDTEENINSICTACGINDVDNNLCCIGGDSVTPPNDNCNTWIYYCNSRMEWLAAQFGCYPYMRPGCGNTYNITELGDRLIFPANFGWDKVMVRWYEDPEMSQIFIPAIALDTFIFGLMSWDKKFSDDRKDQMLADKYERKYERMKFSLLKELNRYRLAELGQIITPPAYVPSYTRGWSNKSEGGANWNWGI